MSSPTEYTISEVAKVFSYSAQWIRWKEAEGLLRYPNGNLIEPIRTLAARQKNTGDRRYTIIMMWHMAKSLQKEGAITEDHLDAILDVLRALKRANKYPIRKKK